MPPMLQVATILDRTMSDGPGPRTSVYFQGCSIGRSPQPCKGCQSRHLWPEQGGTPWHPVELAETLLARGLPVTFIGGEPMDQPAGLWRTIDAIKAKSPATHVIVYTGYTLDELIARGDDDILLVLGVADVLVDGRFILDEDTPFLQFRGSANQRPIDLVMTRKASCWTAPIVLQWDHKLSLRFDSAGRMIVPIGVAKALGAAGATVESTRRCGQVRRKD